MTQKPRKAIISSSNQATIKEGDKVDFGKSIKIALVMKGMTQKELADRMGRHSVYISRVCNNPMASASTIDDVAKALDMKVSELVALGEGE